MKVLIADKFEQSGLRGLESIGCTVDFQPELTGDALTTAIRDSGADVLVVRSTEVTEEMIEAGRLSLIVRAGAGYNTIDVHAASDRGIYVSNCPGKNAVAVAELAFGLITALDRRLVDSTLDLRNGQWNKQEYSRARGLYGRTLGLAGLGQIGREMITRAHAFGMNVVGWSRSLTPEEAAELGIGFRQTIPELANDCDILSVHLPLTPETKGIFGDNLFEVMREGSYFINTSRAEVVDEAALIRAIRLRHLRAGLDVFQDEPATATGEIHGELWQIPGVIGSPHIGASTEQAQEAIAAETVRIIKTYRDTGKVPNVVNVSETSPATHLLVVRHHDRPGVLAHIFNELRKSGNNVQEMENVIFEGARAAIARIGLDYPLSAETLSRIRAGNSDIIELTLLRMH
ncbi:MAG: NAD(P)-dependent oxidoreductase [Blastocatellia bacterium]